MTCRALPCPDLAISILAQHILCQLVKKEKKKRKERKSCFSVSLLDFKVLLLAGGMVKDTAEYRMNACEHCFAKLLQVQQGPQQLKCKVLFSPFFSLAGKDWWALFIYWEWLMAGNSVRKMDCSNCLQHSFIKHWYLFYSFGHLLQLSMLFLVFPICSSYLPTEQFENIFSLSESS